MTFLSDATRTLLRPASNLHVCGLVLFVSALLLLVEVLAIGSRGVFLLVAVVTAACALALVHSVLGREQLPLDARVAHAVSGPRQTRRFDDSFRPDVLPVLLYCAGAVVAMAAYCYLALARSSITSGNQEVIEWGLLDKRPMVFAYLMVVAFVAFHHAMGRLFFDQARAGAPLAKADAGKKHLRWALGVLGAVVIAALAYWWLGLPVLLSVMPQDADALTRIYDLHSHVHMSGYEQMRQGAMPYVEAQTQYGQGNQLLLYFLMRWVNFSNHGFYAANVLLNVVCVVGFFVLLERVLGFGWAFAALVGWLLWPSPYRVMDVGGWTVLTRWIGIPILSLLLAYTLASADMARRGWIAPLVLGAVWGMGSYLSQEHLSGGIIVLALCLMLLGPASGMGLGAIGKFGGLFLAGGVVTFVGLVACSAGIAYLPDVLRLANSRSGLVMAGVTNSVWSDNLGVSAALNVIHGRLYSTFGAQGDLAGLFQTYGFAILSMVVLALLAGFLRRQWSATDDDGRQFVWKFTGVAVGAYVLHLFSLLRSDSTHLAGPSLLLPLFLVMLPLFAWRCVQPGRMRKVLLAISAGVICTAVALGAADIGRRLGEVGTLWRATATVVANYRELQRTRDPSPELAARFSPIPKYQAAFRNHRDFAEAEELFGLLHGKLRGRRVELGFYGVDTLITHPEAFYFFGAFRSVSGITSPKNSIWLRSEEDAWIKQVVGAAGACVFFEPNAKGRLFDAWQQSVKDRPGVVTEPITGKRMYGTLSCKA